MNSYSWLQQKLHRFALSSQLMREATFDVESACVSAAQTNDNHVFVSGLARSGTTILLNALYKSNEFSSLSYKDMPFVLAPNLWSKLSSNKHDTYLVERAHRDGIKVSIDSPEAFEEVFWNTFDYLDSESIEKFKTYVDLINQKNHKGRYLSKNNQNIRRLELISSIFPKSKILIPFRYPIQHAYSLLYQHKRFIEESRRDKFISNYMKWIGHSEFGLDYKMIHPSNLLYPNEKEFNHWLEQWYLTYKSVLELSAEHGEFYLIGYESLCNNPKVWINVKDLLGINQEIKFLFKESKKVIGQTFDNNLSDRCYRLYESLVSKSFGT
jgi:hypothetical protein